MNKKCEPYVENAHKFLEWLYRYSNECGDMSLFQKIPLHYDSTPVDVDAYNFLVHEVLPEWNDTHPEMPMTIASGYTRFAIVIKNYCVLKFDYKIKISDLGNTYTEYNTYQRLKNSEYAYLFAPIKRVFSHSHGFYVMPYVSDIGELRDFEVCMEDYVSEREYHFLYNNFNDLHAGNVGRIGNQVTIIDYASNCYL